MNEAMLKGVSIAGVRLSHEVIDDYTSHKESVIRELTGSS